MDETNPSEGDSAELLRVLGPDLGPVYEALRREVIWIHAKWQEYRKLYAESPGRIELLNGTAGFFFGMIQDVLWEDVLLHLARLTDPPNTSKNAAKSNLTINQLPPLIQIPALAENVRQRVGVAMDRCDFARQWRNRRLAHRDLNLILETSQAIPLPPASRQSVGDALSALATLLNCLESHYFNVTYAFDIFLAHDDANTLVRYLALGAQTDERRRERFRQGKPLAEDMEPPHQI